LLNGLRALPSTLPIQAAYSYSPQFTKTAQQLLQHGSFEVAHIEHLRGAVLAESLGDLPVVFDSVDSIALLFEKVSQGAPSFKSRLIAMLDLARTQRFEGSLTQRFAAVGVTSPADRQALVDLGCAPEAVSVIANGVDLDYFAPMNLERDPKRLVFTGKMSYHANVAAVEDLVHQIMPLVWSQQSDVTLQVVGKDPAPVIQMLGEDPRIEVTGFVADMRPYLAQAAAAVSTVRYGVGIQNKVLEAMAMGTPVVCSSQACSALKTQPGQDLLVGDNPQHIAQHILDLLNTPDTRIALGQAGRRYVESYHSWNQAAAQFEALYHTAVQLRA
jgi:glycosyltransferase involved in cell wall biosynthesis